MRDTDFLVRPAVQLCDIYHHRRRCRGEHGEPEKFKQILKNDHRRLLLRTRKQFPCRGRKGGKEEILAIIVCQFCGDACSAVDSGSAPANPSSDARCCIASMQKAMCWSRSTFSSAPPFVMSSRFTDRANALSFNFFRTDFT